jgi:hypothetical protein
MDHVSWPELDLRRFLLATSVITVVDNLLFYPFDLLKTREHVDRRLLVGRNPLLVTWQQILDCIYTPAGKFQPSGIYRGFWTSSVLNIPGYITYLMAYSYAKHALGWNPEAPASFRTIATPLAAGFFADFVSLAVYVPSEVIIKRVQLKDSPFSNGWPVAKHIFATEGWRGFFAGTGATLLQSGLGSAVWWGVYEQTKMNLARSTLLRSPEKSEKSSRFLPTASQFFSGAVASAVACVVVNPFDVVRSRLQTQGAHREYSNLFDGLQQIVRTEGFLSLSRGLVPKIVSRAPLGAISSYLYELIFQLSKRDPQDLASS